MMTMKDMDALNRAHDMAVKHMGDMAVVIAEQVNEGKTPTEQMLKDYRVARLGVESTRRDLEYCMGLEIAQIESTM